MEEQPVEEAVAAHSEQDYPQVIVKIKSLEELREADMRTLHFLPEGLGNGLRMHEKDAACYQQEAIDAVTLAGTVGPDTRATFDTLRTVWAYGVLAYEIYTLVGDHSLLVIEQALRERFVEYHQAHRGGSVVFVNARGQHHQLTNVTNYLMVWEFLDQARKQRPPRRWRLEVGATSIAFNGTLGGLRRWARTVGLFRGHRNLAAEDNLTDLRNFVAHPAGYHLASPVEAIRHLRDVAEIVNQLWGHPTPGGRLYPVPIQRDVVFLGFTQDHTAVTVESPDFPGDPVVEQLGEAWEWLVIRTATDGIMPRDFDSRYEVDRVPTQVLWGPGSHAAARTWYDEHQPGSDRVDVLDQEFMIRYDAPYLFLPMRPEIVAALSPDERKGTWYVVRADDPTTVWWHAVNLIKEVGCSSDEVCAACRVATVATGSYTDIIADNPRLARAGALPPDVQIGWRHPRFRDLSL